MPATNILSLPEAASLVDTDLLYIAQKSGASYLAKAIEYGDMPRVPGAGVSAYHSTTQSIPRNSTTILSLDSEYYDTDNYHDLVTNNSRLTIPAGLGGWYLASCNVYLSAGSGNRKSVWFYINGVQQIRTSDSTQGGSDQISILHQTWLWNLSAGDYIQYAVRHNNLSTSEDASNQRMSIQLVSFE